VAARLLSVHYGLGQGWRVVLLIPLGTAVFALACRLLAPEVLQELKIVIRRRQAPAPEDIEETQRSSALASSTAAS
jgi:hypothetical protein